VIEDLKKSSLKKSLSLFATNIITSRGYFLLNNQDIEIETYPVKMLIKGTLMDFEK
jgi:hypothetical protein